MQEAPGRSTKETADMRQYKALVKDEGVMLGKPLSRVLV
jgi:hypothetical protein